MKQQRRLEVRVGRGQGRRGGRNRGCDGTQGRSRGGRGDHLVVTGSGGTAAFWTESGESARKAAGHVEPDGLPEHWLAESASVHIRDKHKTLAELPNPKWGKCQASLCCEWIKQALGLIRPEWQK